MVLIIVKIKKQMQIEKSEKLVWMTLYFKLKDHSRIEVLEFKEICSIGIKRKQ